MLRVVVVLLVLANALFFAWERGYLGAQDGPSGHGREPERLAQQVRPQDIRLLNAPVTQVDTAPTPAPATSSAVAPGAVAAASAGMDPSPPVGTGAGASTPPATSCWTAGGFTAAQAEALEQALLSRPELRGRWQITETRTGGRWVVYMGPYDEALMARKKSELRNLKVDFREVTVPKIGRGLALGTLSSEESAAQALRDLGRRGVRSARVALERPEGLSHTLTLSDITEAQRAQVALLGVAMGGKRLQPCD